MTAMFIIKGALSLGTAYFISWTVNAILIWSADRKESEAKKNEVDSE